MKKPNKLFVFLCLSAIFISNCNFSMSGSSSKEEPPNIIFILTDDMDAASLAYMPKTLELIGKQGATFSRFFVSMSSCCPSRTTILRGQFSHNTKIFATELPDGGFETFYALNEEDSTIAVWLEKAGYNTALFGKYLNGYPNTAKQTYIPDGWTEWYSPVEGEPYSQYNYTLNENGKMVEYGDQPQDYGTDVYATKSIDFIERNLDDGEPFFAHISVYAPHGPSTPAPRHADLFADVPLPRPPSFNEEDVSDKPPLYSSEPLLDDEIIAMMERNYRNRLQSLQAVDEMVENIILTLEAHGALENTYIFFSSDNGFHMGQHRLYPGKDTAYEEDILVPALVRGPGIQAGLIINDLAGNVDLASTFAEMAGIQTPEFVDGRSLMPLLTGDGSSEQVEWRGAYLLERGILDETVSAQDIFISANRVNLYSSLLEPPDSPFALKTDRSYRGLRTQDYTYVKYGDGILELYDLKADPYQLQNIASTAPPSLLKELDNWLDSLRQCAGASCRENEVKPD